MVSKKVELQRWSRVFREREGRDLSSHEIAEMLKAEGWPMPKPKDEIDLLAKQVSDAEGEETIYDEVLGDSVGRNICYKVEGPDGKQITLWGELDTSTRKKMDGHKTLLRDQSVGDVYQATIKCMRWNRLHPGEQQILFEPDFTPDMEWLLAAKQAKGKKAA
jgi:hypothetical protein